MFRFARFAFTCASLLLLASRGVPAQYSFVNIADTRGPFESFDFFAQAVSNTGTVAFIGHQGVAATYLGSGGPVQQIVPDLSPPLGFNGGASNLNASGVAVGGIGRCCNPTETKVLLYEATGTRTLAEATNSATALHEVYSGGINNSGAVAILSRHNSLGGEGDQVSITRWFDGTSTTVLETAEGFENVSFRLNEQGEVAFLGSRDHPEWAYYRTDGTALTLIADSTGPLSIPQGPPSNALSVNDSGAVAFWSPLDAGGEGIFVGDGGPLTTVVIADPTTPFNDLMWNNSIDINNQGTFAFFAGLWDGRNGIFTGPDPLNDKVIAHGDFLFGQFVTGLGRPHLNERGDIAFWFEVRDPRNHDGSGYWSGIALAVKQSSVPGDYNLDGTVDAADYVVWRNNNGGNYTPNDFNTWRAHFGQTAGSGAATYLAPGESPEANSAVPEPAAAVMLITGLLLQFVRRRTVVP